MFKFITHKSFLVNLLVIILLILLVVFIFFSLLGVITKHDEIQKVPNLVGKSYDEAKQILQATGLEAGIQDSVYVDTTKALQVVRQSPDVDATVKTGRTIYLTINRAVPPQIEMPDLRGFSLKSAELYLQSLGLKMGDTTYVPDIARNAVREQLVNGKPILPGTKINMGSSISLVIGSGLGRVEMNVPDLLGMTVAQAKSYLNTNNIELGAVLALDRLTDTANAFIARQNPAPYVEDATSNEMIPNKIRPGQLIDIWISNTPPSGDSSVSGSPN